MNANDAVERLREQVEAYWKPASHKISADDARAILAAFDALTAELAAAKGERAQIVALKVAVYGCDDSTYATVDASPAETAFLDKVAAAITAASTYGCMPTMGVERIGSGAHLTSEGEA